MRRQFLLLYIQMNAIGPCMRLFDINESDLLKQEAEINNRLPETRMDEESLGKMFILLVQK